MYASNKPLLACIVAIIMSVIAGCEQDSNSDDYLPLRSLEDQVGTRFSDVPSYDFKAPTITEIPLDCAPTAKAIWGAIGRNDQGLLYIGASTSARHDGTAFLYQYDPASSTLEPQGDVVGQLKRLGLHEPGMGQNKLHSKFYQADDGYLYFSSFDEQGEGTDRNPTWGGHLWRKKADEKNWQHLLATPEALMAVNLADRYVYALGYWDHVLYQFNTETSEVKRVVVGSVANHISRNFLVDPRGHAYVPKISLEPSGAVQATLQEYDTNLVNVGSYDLPSYRHKDMARHHGIVGYTSMANGDIVFTTSDGGLYILNGYASSSDKLRYLGMMHPEGAAYIPSLFPLDGRNLIAGVSRSKKGYEWIIYELQTRFAATYPLDTAKLRDVLLYGTLTRDNQGNFYLVGRSRNKQQGSVRPVLLKIPVLSLWPPGQ